MMYVSEIFMLYTLNLHSTVSQLYFSKTGKDKINHSFKKNK